VPLLKDGDVAIWDSLAICEYVAEALPQANLWPQDRIARALGRCACAEMHSGFHSLRGELSMDLARREPATLVPATEDDVRRVVALWNQLLRRFGGPFLLGPDWSVADAFFTPVATRLRSYGVLPSDYGDTGAAGAYAERLLEQPEYLEWERDALAAAPAA
jgi:glutathione S-transferase